MSNLTIIEYTLAQQQALAEISEKIDDAELNNNHLTNLQNNLTTEADSFELTINTITPRLNAVNTIVQQTSSDFDTLITQEETLYNSILQRGVNSFTLTLGGTKDYFYPIWFTFNCEFMSFLEISRTPELNQNLFSNIKTQTPGCYMYIEGCGYDVEADIPGRFTVRKFDEINDYCIILPNPNMYCSKESEASKGYYAVGVSGLYLRGGLTYNFRTNDKDVETNIKTIFDIGVLTEYIFTGLDMETYYTTPLTFTGNTEITWDENLYVDYSETQTQPQRGGDIAIHSGGEVADDTRTTIIQQSVISTSSDSVAMGNLVRYVTFHTSVSNGISDVGLHCGGMSAPTAAINNIQQSIISTCSDAVNTGVLTAINSSSSGTSNGIDDISLLIGGASSYKDSIESGVISTGENTTIVNNLSHYLTNSAATSNATDDICVSAGGYNHDLTLVLDDINIHIISTHVLTENTGTLMNQISQFNAISNGELDKVIYTRGVSQPTVIFNRQQSIISTGADAINVADFGIKLIDTASTSNATGDFGINAGGVNLAADIDVITQFIISSGIDTTETGTLTPGLCKRMKSCSNG